MKIVVAKAELQSKLKFAGMLLQSKNYGLLSEFLFKIKDGKLSITGGCEYGNIEVMVNCELSGMDMPEDSFTISPDILIKSISGLPNQPITIAICASENKSRESRFTHASGGFTIPIGDASEYHTIKMTGTQECASFHAGILKEGISGVYPVSEENELRPVLGGVYIDKIGGSVSFVSINKYGSCFGVVRKDDAGGRDIQLNIPRIIAKCIRDILSMKKYDNDIDIRISGNSAAIKIDDIEVVFLLIEGIYANYKAVIPKNEKIEIHLNREDFTKSVERTRLFSGNSIAKISTKGDAVSISTEDVIFSRGASERINTQNGAVDDFEISINLDNVLNVLPLLPSESIKLQFTDNKSPFTARCVDDNSGYDRLYVISSYGSE